MAKDSRFCAHSILQGAECLMGQMVTRMRLLLKMICFFRSRALANGQAVLDLPFQRLHIATPVISWLDYLARGL